MREKKHVYNSLRVDVTLAVRELSQKLHSNVNISSTATPQGIQQ